MKGEKLDVARGSGNVFRDFGHKNADVEQFKAILGAEIIRALDREHLTVRAAHDRTGIAAADFSASVMRTWGGSPSIGSCRLSTGSGSRVEVKVRVRRAETVAHEAPA